MSHRLRSGATLEILQWAYVLEKKTTCYIALLTNVSGKHFVKLAELDYYTILKNNDIPIPYYMLRPGDPGYELKDNATVHDCNGTKKYELKDGKILHISNVCMKSPQLPQPSQFQSYHLPPQQLSSQLPPEQLSLLLPPQQSPKIQSPEIQSLETQPPLYQSSQPLVYHLSQPPVYQSQVQSSYGLGLPSSPPPYQPKVCLHNGVYDGMKWCGDGCTIKRILLLNDINDLGHFADC